MYTGYLLGAGTDTMLLSFCCCVGSGPLLLAVFLLLLLASSSAVLSVLLCALRNDTVTHVPLGFGLPQGQIKPSRSFK